jgi:serine protease
MLRGYLFLFLLIPFFGIGPAMAQDASQAKIIPGRLVFKLKAEYKASAGSNPAKLEKLQNALQLVQATNLVRKFPRAVLPEGNPDAVDLSLVYQVALPPSQSPEKAAALLRKTGLVEYAEAMRQFDPLYEPNDPYADSMLASNQYYLKNIRAYKAWDIEKGDTSIVIGISDTGTRYTHKELVRMIKYNYADRIDGLDNDNDGYTDNFRGWDMADDDNDATDNSSHSAHGIQVAGVSSAQADNAKGIAGVGFNCKYLPIKIYPGPGGGSFAGYESIVYAADHGCSIINLSWGGPALPSLFEQDVINYAVFNKNAVVVAAAGNTPANLFVYPASYDNVLSVATLDKLNRKSTNATFNTLVDLSAPGVSIITTQFTHDSSYFTVGGSSFAAPMVAGAAGLVKKKFPQFKAEQIAQQLRVTANPVIYTVAANATFTDMLGKGILDVAKALATTNAKSVRITNIRSNTPQFGAAGDTMDLTLELKNYLNPLTNLGMTITSTSPDIVITRSAVTVGPMATLATTSTNTPFRVYIKPTAPINKKITFRFTFTDGTYNDYQYVSVVVNQDYITIDINEVDVTVTSKGNIGYQNFNADQGHGIRYRRQNLLSEGGLVVANAANAVSDNVRDATISPDNDFFSQARVHLINSVKADMEAEGAMADSFPVAGMVGVGVTYRAYAWDQAPYNKFVILEYKIKNLRTTMLSNLYAGIFADWDIFDSSRNTARYDAGSQTGYVYNVKYDTLYAGIKLLSNLPPAFNAFDLYNPPASSINIADGFTDAEKFQALSNGLARLTAGTTTSGNDVSYMIGAKLPNLAPNDTATVAFAILAGDNLTDLVASAHNAQLAYTQGPLAPTGSREDAAANSGLLVFPNPASSVLHVKLPETGNGITQLELLDALGRSVDRKSAKHGETVSFNIENLPSGLYMIRTESKTGRQVQKVQLLK